jgi:hypothetical protein
MATDGVPNGGKQRDERIAYGTLDRFTSDGIRDRLWGASPRATELEHLQIFGEIKRV